MFREAKLAKSDYPAKYADLIDDEIWAFIERTNSFYPPETADYPIEKQREIYNRLCAGFHAGYPDGVEAVDIGIEVSDHVIPTRTYTLNGSKSDVSVVYYHGGGFVVGGLESHDDVCAEICARTGFKVVSIDYRMSPEFNYPHDFRDALAGFNHVAAENAGPVVVCGDSAGGNLAAAVSHATRNSDLRPVGQVLIYPGLGSMLDQGTFITHADAPMLTTKDTTFYKTVRTGGNAGFFDEPTCAPLNDTDFSALPPTVLISAECDPLSGDSGDYHRAILAAGGKSHWVDEKGLVHGYLRARHMSSRARDSFSRIVDAVSHLGKGEWPY